jgi:hypothetical protein
VCGRCVGVSVCWCALRFASFYACPRHRRGDHGHARNNTPATRTRTRALQHTHTHTITHTHTHTHTHTTSRTRQGHEANQALLGKGGVDTLLVVLAGFKSREPADDLEAELVENLFDTLCCCLLTPENRCVCACCVCVCVVCVFFLGGGEGEGPAATW